MASFLGIMNTEANKDNALSAEEKLTDALAKLEKAAKEGDHDEFCLVLEDNEAIEHKHLNQLLLVVIKSFRTTGEHHFIVETLLR
jgi:hypothetical protein